ncbi:peroxidase P7-like [Rhododendron vialii]|uniref:peroxidase P7-like n=1 Tax=Rhododendron vialii TaxID=182163 RepID=UPI00265F1725|nr:peroxidase P7-like [Rhododendron vialii]
MATSVVHSSVCIVVFFSIVALIPASSGQYPTSSGQYPSTSGNCYPAYTSGTSLTPDYYQFTCPGIFDIVRDIVQKAIDCDRRMGASLLRLHFHDCWVNGCDGSVLLVNTAYFVGEQSAIPNINSLRGFDVVAAIKSALNKKCLCGNVVSCADILAIAASQSVEILGGPCYQVLLGRKDSLTASEAAANADLPSPFASIASLLANFAAKGFGIQELVPLSGAHTIGRARCGTFKSLLNDNETNAAFAAGLEENCFAIAAAGGNYTVPLDNTTTVFDTVYFQMLKEKMGLLHSDRELYYGGNQKSADLVMSYSSNQAAFWADFASAMIKMGNLPPSSPDGQIRCNCSIPNYPYPPNSLLNFLPSICPFTHFTCPSSPLVSLSSLFNIGTPPTYCSSPVTSSSYPGTSSPDPYPATSSPSTGTAYPPT